MKQSPLRQRGVTMRVRGTNEEDPLLAQGALFEHSIPTLAVMAETQNKLAAQVLIVDDEPDHADVMADALRKPGHVCTIVNTVEAALDERVREFLARDGGGLEVIGIEDNRVPGSYQGACGSSTSGTLMVIQNALTIALNHEIEGVPV